MDKLILKFRSLPEFARMVIIAIIGAVIGFITYEIIYILNPFTPKATISWFLSNIIGIARQHTLHRKLTFTHKTPYWQSLMKAYVMYSSSLALGSLLNWILTEMIHLDHRVSWACCLIVTSIISLVFLKKFVFRISSTEKIQQFQESKKF